jgi:hypothetical protein
MEQAFIHMKYISFIYHPIFLLLNVIDLKSRLIIKWQSHLHPLP